MLSILTEVVAISKKGVRIKIYHSFFIAPSVLFDLSKIIILYSLSQCFGVLQMIPSFHKILSIGTVVSYQNRDDVSVLTGAMEKDM